MSEEKLVFFFNTLSSFYCSCTFQTRIIKLIFINLFLLSWRKKTFFCEVCLFVAVNKITRSERRPARLILFNLTYHWIDSQANTHESQWLIKDGLLVLRRGKPKQNKNWGILITVDTKPLLWTRSWASSIPSTFISCLPELHPDLILPSSIQSSRYTFSKMFSKQNSICNSVILFYAILASCVTCHRLLNFSLLRVPGDLYKSPVSSV